MAAFATVDDFLNLFEISLDGTDKYPVSPADKQKSIAQINSMLDKATSEILLYVASSYVVSPANTPPYLNYACSVIAGKSLERFVDREKIRTDYEDVIGKLEAISTGKLSLVGKNGRALKPIAGSPLAQVEGQAKVRSRTYIANRAVGTTVIDFGTCKKKMYSECVARSAQEMYTQIAQLGLTPMTPAPSPAPTPSATPSPSPTPSGTTTLYIQDQVWVDSVGNKVMVVIEKQSDGRSLFKLTEVA